MNSRMMICAALFGAGVVASHDAALAGAADYVFEPVKVAVKSGAGSELAVRLMHKPSNKAVDGAIVFRTRLDMSPDAMGDMTASIEPMPAAPDGVYRFKADLTMAGRWALKLMAKVPGESETVEGSIVFQAED
ncbi:MAG TPA: FixH family protein [Hyphomicrobium sp.]|nr:FixH family protein [Hyphomicrobium sp.]